MSWSKHRLSSADEFRAVTRGGARSARSHVVVHLSQLTQGEDAPRVGFVVSKRIGNAVVRNRVTRRLREIIRPAIVVRALPGIDAQPFSALKDDVDSALGSASGKLARRREAAR